MPTNKIIINDVTLRDGMHANSHQYTKEQVQQLTKHIDASGANIIEVGHGDGLGGSSIQYGFSKETDETMIKTAVQYAKNARIAVLLIPGIGTLYDLQRAYECGAHVVKVATHCTEATLSKQALTYANDIGMEAIGFLMMSHLASPAQLVEQAKRMESYGATCVYCVDTAGAFLMDDVRERIYTLKENLSGEVGFHAHNNLSLAVANSIVAIEEGATRIDASLAGMGAGAGNTATEQLIAVMNRMEMTHDVDLYKTMDAAENVMKSMMERPVQIDQYSLTVGYAGVVSTFLVPALAAAKEYNIDARDILVELGREKALVGQEDMIRTIAKRLGNSM